MKKKLHIGEIYYVDPKHLIKPEELDAYRKKKGNDNYRPVIIVKEKRKKKVQISKMTSVKPKNSQDRIRLERTFPDKKSYASTQTIARSEAMNKHFKLGEDPLAGKPSRKVHDDDFKEYNDARDKRYRIKKKNPANK